MKITKTITIASVVLSLTVSCQCDATQSDNKCCETEAFPYTVTEATPNRANLSKAVERSFTDFLAYRPQDNPLFTNFKYTQFEGFDYNGGDGTISRRDPSKTIKVGDKYYMWYTRRETKVPPIGASNADKCDDETPSTDWDLAEIWYATSKDGFTWEEQGAAVPRRPKPQPGHRSVSTPDILVWQGRYYLYYQAFMEPSGLKGDYCPVSMSSADSPDGPWEHVNGEIISTGKEGEWDQFAVHDPYPLVHDGKIFLYYKSAFNRPDKLWVAGGLMTAEKPEGPFERSPNNPVLNSGHELVLFPFREGVAAILTSDGNEHNTIQYAADWVNFDLASVVSIPPIAAAPYVADAFTDTKYGEGITWGACHFTGMGKPRQNYSILARFDCSLQDNISESSFKTTRVTIKPEVYFANGMNKNVKKHRKEINTLK